MEVPAMSVSRKRRIFLLTWTIFCAAVLSCKPEGTATTREKPRTGAAEGRVETPKKTLSKKQIIAAANAALRRHGKSPDRYKVLYDEGNANWMDLLRRSHGSMAPELAGHDYQVVIYNWPDQVQERCRGSLSIGTPERNSASRC
jgi:hypothetical protein